MVQRALARSSGTLATAARLLGISRPTLYTLLEAHGLANSAGAVQDGTGQDGGADGPAGAGAVPGRRCRRRPHSGSGKRMNRFIIPAAAVILAAGAGGGAYIYTHRATSLQNGRALMAKGDLRGAQIELRNAVRSNPKDAEAHASLAQAQVLSGDFDAAEREVRTARDLGYSADASVPVLAQALIGQRRWADVLAQVPPTAAKPDEAARNLAFRSVAQVNLRDIAGASASVAEALRLAPADVEVLGTATRLSIFQNDLPEADARADRALAAAPNRPEGLIMKAQVQTLRGDRAGAVATLDRAVAAAPDRLQIRLQRAELLLQTGQADRARADVAEVLAKDPKNPYASYFDLILLVQARKFAEADQEVTKLEPLLARFPRGLYFQAVVKASLNQLETAADAASRYVARVPNDPDGVRLLARIQLAAARPDQAVATLVNAVKSGMNDAETMDMLGRAYAAGGQAPQAADSFQKASELAPENPDILTRLATSKMQMGDTGGATTALERSLEMAPNQVNAEEALVAAALAAGDADRAQAAVDRMKKQSGDTESVGVLDALVKLAKRDIEGAQAEFADLAKRFPQSVVAPVNLAKVFLVQGKTAEAEAALRGVLARSPAEPQALGPLVNELVRQNRLADAVAALQAARAAAPGNLSIVAAVADLQVRLKDTAGALATLNQVQSNAGGVMPTVLLPALARAQAAGGGMEEAKATLGRYVAANPADLDTLRSYVELLVNNNSVPEAQKVLAESLRSAPGNIGMMLASVQIELKYNGLPAALAKAEELRRNPANLPNAAVLKGDLLMAAQRYADAAVAYAEEAKAAPSSLLTLRQSSALVNTHSPDQASALLKTWLGQHPGDAEAAQVLGSLDINARRLSEAETHLKVVLATRPNDPIALNNLAWVYQQRNNPEALALARRAYTLSPTTESADTLGWILVTSGKPSEGLPLVRQAATARPADPSLQYHLAAALNGAGQKEEALKVLGALPLQSASFEEKPAAQKLLVDLTAGR